MWRWGSQPHGTEPISRRRAPVCRKLNTVQAATIGRRWLQLCAGACTHRADGKSKPTIQPSQKGRYTYERGSPTASELFNDDWFQLKARSADGLAADDALIGEEPAKLLLPHESMRPD